MQEVIAMSIGQRIGKLRKDNGYSQEFIAERLGVSRQAVSKWETDASAPDTYNLIALAELLHTSVEYLATGKEAAATPSRESAPRPLNARVIVGSILLGSGLLSLILGVLMSDALILMSFYLILGGILCLTVKRALCLTIAWSCIGLTLLLSLTIARPFFFPISSGGTSYPSGSLFFFLFAAAVTAITVVRIIKRKRRQKDEQTRNKFL